MELGPVNVIELESLARARLDPARFDYFAGGACDEVTLRLNRKGFDRILLRSRILRDVSRRSLATTVLGQPVSLPVLLGPTGHQALAHPHGELAVARAAAAAGTITIVSTVASFPLEEIARAAKGTRWFQLYCYPDRRISEWMLRRAANAGYSAVCLTVDAPVLGRRERDFRNGFDLLGLEVPNLSASASMELKDGLRAEEVAAWSRSNFDDRLTWDDVAWIRSTTELPLVIKGVMTPEDAQMAVRHGAAAIVVSNHGGRQLDGVPATIDVLPEIVAAAGTNLEVLLDGGVRRGTDVLKALALGARAVLIGRPVLWGLAVDGEAGVQRVVDCLAAELDTALALVGLQSIRDVDATILHRTTHP